MSLFATCLESFLPGSPTFHGRAKERVVIRVILIDHFRIPEEYQKSFVTPIMSYTP